MSEILFAMMDGGGNVAPTLLVAAQLGARGHRVRVMSDEVSRAEAESAGVTFIPWTRAPSKQVRSRETDAPDWMASSTLAALEMIAEHFMGSTAAAYARDLAEELDQRPADLVITLDMLVGVMVACEARGQRLALLNTYISTFPQPGVPPFASGLAPPATEAERTRQVDAAAALEAALDTGLPALNAARAELGLAPLHHLADQARAAEVLWLATAQAFDFAPDPLPPRVRYVGPLIADPQWAQPWTSPWPSDDARPLIVAGFSTSFQDHVDVLQRLIDAAADLPVRLLVTRSGSIRAEELTAAANCMIVDSAPHSKVMRLASVVVTHGGHGTVMTALANLVPMLVFPHGRDQDDNAVRITERGAGLSLPKDATVAEIQQALIKLLGDPSFRSGARRLGEAVLAEVDASTLIHDIESLASEALAVSREAIETCL